jgi:2-succinyl-5-enolpyruvyl-6-hydroxy-3-cyclohexene-1-carboxylate synthase
MPAKNEIPNVNCLWGEVVAGTLARLGLKRVVIAPGSRSAPLVWGLTRQKGIEAIPVLDERSAGFYALGLAKASGLPVALVCTSGTAAANFFPAVIEASESGVPLLVLTADRPPELRDCHAGQAIDQVKIYGSFVRWQHELALPESRLEMLRYLRQTLVHAWERLVRPWAGPVHLNFPLREPLAPVAVEGFAGPGSKELAALVEEVIEPQWLSIQMGGRTLNAPVKGILAAKAGVIVAGCGNRPNEFFLEHFFDLALQLRGWPVLTDVLSPARHGKYASVPLVAHYDLILRSKKHRSRLKPKAIIQLGPLPTSKVLREWLKSLEVPVLILAEEESNLDPLHRQAVHWRGDLSLLFHPGGKKLEADSAYVNRWKKLEEQSAKAVAERFAKVDWLFEGKAAWVLSRVLPKGTPVFVASSMPVRDCEYFWEAGGGQEIYANRGANGIDGTLSTALGVAHAMGQPAVLYTGDLALLHDQNGFLAAKELRAGASLTIVLINNDGSGIFEHLPMAKFDPPFERYFATPQGVDFAKLADLHGAEYICPKSWATFEEAVRMLPERGLRLVELRTDRKRDAAFRKKLFKEIAAKLG